MTCATRVFQAFFCFAVSIGAITNTAHGQTEVISPSGDVRCRVLYDGPKLRFEAALRGQPVIESSPLVMTVDGVEITAGAHPGAVETYSVDQAFPTRGVHARAVDRARGARIALTAAGNQTPYTLEIRAADDGVAYRFIVPGGPDKRVPDESSTFTLPAGTTVWSHDLRGHYEAQHEKNAIESLATDRWAAPPVTFRLPAGAGYGSITESVLANYSGMALQADGRRGLTVRLAHAHPASYPFTLRYGEAEAARLAHPAAIAGTITTPWRVVMIAADLNGLVNADLVGNLAPAPDPELFPQGAATPWVKPGRAVWEYLDGRRSTVAEMKEYNRMAGELGFEYNVLEGFWRRFSDADLRGLIADGKARNVGIWLWVHSKELRDPAARQQLFDRFRDLGVAGVKLDFFDHEAKEIIDLYQALLRECAEHHLLVNFHGSNKPAGESRTWPNELTREAVRGMENRSMKIRSRHDTTLPFTRLLAGHADYTPVHFGERRGDTSAAHQIASAALLTSPLLTYAASPRTLLAHPALEIIKSIPATWDETIVLPASEIGELVLFARRSGDRWFLAAMNGPSPRTLDVPLGFLGAGPYQTLLVRDDKDDPAAVRIDQSRSTRDGSLSIDLSAGGGFAARFARE